MSDQEERRVHRSGLVASAIPVKRKTRTKKVAASTTGTEPEVRVIEREEMSDSEDNMHTLGSQNRNANQARAGNDQGQDNANPIGLEFGSAWETSRADTLQKQLDRLMLEKVKNENSAHTEMMILMKKLENLSHTVTELKDENSELRKHRDGNENGGEAEPPPVVVPSYIFDPIVSIPCYDSTRMTPEAFLLEVEEHLTWKNADKSSWLLLVTRMFKKDSDISRWWRETKLCIKSWDEFKAAFMKYEQSGLSKDILFAQLFAKRQKLSEVFETFAWDVNGAYRKINPRVAPAEVIDRIVNSALPEIAVMLRNCTFSSVAELIFKAREIISDLNKGRLREGKPLLLARDSDSQGAERTRTFTRKPWNSNYARDNSDKDKEPSKEQNSEQNKEAPGPSSKPPTNSTNYRGNSTYNRQTRNLKDISCFYCEKKGHVIKDCKKRMYDEKQKNAGQNRQSSDEQKN
jgi:hypothetical protein